MSLVAIPSASAAAATLSPVSSYGRLCAKTVVITGAGAGMGRAGAMLFAREGANVAICDIDGEALMETERLVRAATGVEVYAEQFDLTDVGAIARFGAAALARFTVVDIVYNNAGKTVVKSIEETTVEDWDQLHSINVRAAAFLVKALLPGLRRSAAGAVINVASGAAVEASVPGNTAYCSSKGAVLALTRAQARDLAADNVRVNCILPGPVETDMVRHHFDSLPAEEAAQRREEYAGMTMLKRFAHPDQVAAVAVYLATPEAAFINAAAIPVDDGMTAM
jgi:NAD(P)-dependent dehydrogenase (short-subunit alcohol dehydrogenase family)